MSESWRERRPRPAPLVIVEPTESGVRLSERASTVALVEPFFAVLFDCGGHLSFQSSLDALDCMKKYAGAVGVIMLPGRVPIAVPRTLSYAPIWLMKTEPEWVSQ